MAVGRSGRGRKEKEKEKEKKQGPGWQPSSDTGKGDLVACWLESRLDGD